MFNFFKFAAVTADQMIQLHELVENGPESFLIRAETSICHILPVEMFLQEAAFKKDQLVVVKAPKRSGAEF